MLRRFILTLIVSVFVTVASAADVLQKGDLVAVCGDSITEQKQYSVMIEEYLTMCRAEPIRTAQFGWSGDSMGWLFGRGSQAHILALKPTVVTTCYGMNDGGYKALDPEVLKKYADGMARLIDELKAGGVRTIVVGSPGCVDTETFRNNPELAVTYNKTLGALGDAGRELAEKNQMPFADVHAAMADVMAKAKAKYGSKYHLAGGDGVHPSANGQLVMAYAFLKAMGVDGEIGTFRLNMADGAAQASAGHKVVSAKSGELTIESSRYPFCFYGEPSDPGATAGVIEFFPFNADLNRLTLIVTGAPAKARVTWGDQSKEFTGEQLAAGINLAEQFLQNPFSGPFKAVEAKIRDKQNYETSLYKGFFANYDLMQTAMQEQDPTAADSLAKIREAMIARDARMADAAVASVVPVTHTIKIEAIQ